MAQKSRFSDWLVEEGRVETPPYPILSLCLSLRPGSALIELHNI